MSWGPTTSRPRRLTTRRRNSRRSASPTILALESRLLLSAAGDLLTYHGDNASTGLNPYETVLTPTNVQNTSVAAPSFGKLYSVPMDGQVYAQTLTESGVTIGGVSHNVVFVATEHDSLYAIDTTTGAILWHDSFIDPAHGITTVPANPNGENDTGTNDLTPEIGITSTPVIDPTTNILYLVAKTKEIVASGPNAGVNFVQRLHAIDITTGHEALGGPAVIADTLDNGGFQYYSGPLVAGTAQPLVTIGSTNYVYYNALLQHQRAALSLVTDGHGGQTVYFGAASHGDNGPYHGWLLGYDASSLAPKAVMNLDPNGYDAGIWQSGGKVAADAQGNLYVETGNGTFEETLTAPPSGFSRGFPSGGDYGDSVVKLSPDPSTAASPNQNGWGLKVADYFTPSNEASLSNSDADLGSGGVLLVDDPTAGSAHPHLLIAAGKEGRIYVIDRDTGKMGEFDPASDHVVQESSPGTVNASFDTPGLFNGSFYYVGGYGDVAKQFSFADALAGSFPVISNSPDGNFNFPGSTPTISANGTTNGLVWTLDTGPNVLRAYDATNLFNERFSSNQAPRGIDQPGNVVKFSLPTVSQGQVYVGTKNALAVYGLLPPITTVPPAPTNLAAKATVSQVELTWVDPAHGITGFKVERSDNGGPFNVIATLGAGATSYIDAGVPSGPGHQYEVVATNSIGDSNPSAPLSVTLAAPVPAPWQDGDLGGPALAGSAGYSGGTFTAIASGNDIWNNSDQFHYIYQPVSGDFSITTRVASLDYADYFSKAGLMVRNSLDPADANVLLALTPGGFGVEFQSRPVAGGGSQVDNQVGGVFTPEWVRLVRQGSNFDAFDSADGRTWNFIGSTTVSMNTSVEVGLAVTSHNNSIRAAASFDNVSLATTPLPAGFSDADIGGPGYAGTAAYDPTSRSFTVVGGGSDIYLPPDQFHYAYKTASGDGQIIAQVTSRTDSNYYAKSGIMFRDSTDPAASYAYLFVDDRGVTLEGRSADGGGFVGGINDPSLHVSAWVKLVRRGGTFLAYDSADGVTWNPVGTIQATMSPTAALAGLAVTAHDNNQLNASTFSNVSFVTVPYSTYTAIDAGGPAAGRFDSDADFTGGNTAGFGDPIDTSRVVNPAPQAVYQTERWGPFTYTIPNLTPGQSYSVRLHFAEIYFNGPNQRQFNVVINGQQVLTNFDVFAAAGGKDKAIVKTFLARADVSGQVTIQFTAGAHDNPKVSGIEVIRSQAAPGATTRSSGLVYNRTTGLFTGTLTITNNGGTDLSGPLALVLRYLTPGVTLANATGLTDSGDPYLILDVGTLARGQSATLTLQFRNPGFKFIQYRPVVTASVPLS